MEGGVDIFRRGINLTVFVSGVHAIPPHPPSTRLLR